MAPQASELEVMGDALVNTTAENSQINELGSTRTTPSDLERQGRNPATTQKSKTKKKKYSVDVLGSKALQFQAIIQLLQLVDVLIANSKNQKHEDKHCNKKLSSATRKAFDYVDAITNLMVRNGEVVAAVACGSEGVISCNASNTSSSSDDDENAKVCPH